MDLTLDVGKLLLGGFVLYLGAEWLVRGAAGLALAYGVKPLVIGLTVVAYGTSAPELAVSGAAMIDEKSAIVLGNVIGSCIANIAMILGLTALIKPPEVDPRLIRREVPLLLLSVAVVPLILLDDVIRWYEAAVLCGGSVFFTIWALKSEGSPNIPELEELEEVAEAGGAPGGGGKLRLYAITAGGLGLLLGGGEIFVDGAVGVALAAGMSERVVGLTIIAVGTSLPELAACVVAALRGHSEIAVGNVVGSNIFNIFLILGVVPFINPVHAPLSALSVDLYFLAGVTLFGAFVMRGDRRVTRVEGALLMAAYVGFVATAFINN